MELSIYVHIPYCASKCNYCNFVSFLNKEDTFLDYEQVLEHELDKIDKKDYVVKTIYFGGGTPSFYSEKCIEKVLQKIKKDFKCDLKEVTIEVNPNSINEEKLIKYKEIGINRISIGVQSLNDEALSFVNRPHTSKQAIEAIKLTSKHFDNISGDIIINLPYTKEDDAIVTAKTLIDLNVKHISAYGLQIEEGTPLYKEYKKNPNLLNEDESANRYEKLVEFLKERGYFRYEISNFCIGDYYSRHNLCYWNRGDYLGIGCAAHSLIKGERFNNSENLEKYLNKKDIGINRYKLDREDSIEETIMLSLRTKWGLDLKLLTKKYNYDILTEKNKEIEKHIKFGNIVVENDKIMVTDKGQYISNSIILDLI